MSSGALLSSDEGSQRSFERSDSERSGTASNQGIDRKRGRESDNDSAQSDRLVRIQKIARSSSMSPKSKAEAMQRIFSEPAICKRRTGDDEELEVVVEKSEVSQVVDGVKVSISKIPRKEDGRFGCKHYVRKCALVPACCNEEENATPVLYMCRLCHDEKEGHTMDRYATKKVVCLLCNTMQDVGEKCVNCGETFAKYFCDVCKFYEDEDKNIYHCSDCNLCRLGRREDNQHCNRCGACISVESFPKHKCREGSLDAHCPICTEYLFTSVEKVVILRCGHSLHHKCFQDYIKGDFRCPLCLKSVADFKPFFAKWEEMHREALPPDLANRMVYVACNDCQMKSYTPFRTQFMRCMHCSSHNTRPIGRDATERATAEAGSLR